MCEVAGRIQPRISRGSGFLEFLHLHEMSATFPSRHQQQQFSNCIQSWPHSSLKDKFSEAQLRDLRLHFGAVGGARYPNFAQTPVHLAGRGQSCGRR